MTTRSGGHTADHGSRRTGSSDFHISLDDYHIVAVHRDTFGKQGYLDNEVVRYYRFGWHSAYFYGEATSARRNGGAMPQRHL